MSANPLAESNDAAVCTDAAAWSVVQVDGTHVGVAEGDRLFRLHDADVVDCGQSVVLWKAEMPGLEATPEMLLSQNHVDARHGCHNHRNFRVSPTKLTKFPNELAATIEQVVLCSSEVLVFKK